MMKYIRHDHKGVTLMEMIIVISIIGIIMIPISSFFISNLKSFNMAEHQMEAQYQAQMAMNHILDIAIESYGITEIRDNSIPAVDKTSTSEACSISKLVFQTDSSGSSTFTFQMNGYCLMGYSGTTELANHIKSIWIAPIPVTETYDSPDSKGIRITITSEVENQEIQLTNQVYFRNK